MSELERDESEVRPCGLMQDPQHLPVGLLLERYAERQRVLLEETEPDLATAWRPGPPFTLILDSDALLASVDNHCRTTVPSRILRLSESAEATLYAADHVFEEVYRGFSRLASHSASVDELRSLFEREYLPRIRFVEVPEARPDDARVAAVLAVDRTDVPTAVLARLLAPAVVLSADRHLRKTGFAPEEWRVVAGVAINVGKTGRQQHAAVVLPALPVAGIVSGARLALQKAPMAALAGAALLGFGGGILLGNPDRRRRIWAIVRPLAEGYVEYMSMLAEEHNAVVAVIRNAAVAPDVEPSWAELIARELVHEAAAVGAPTLGQRLGRWESPGVSTIAAIRATVAANPAFVERSRGRWQLGRVRETPGNRAQVGLSHGLDVDRW